MGYLENRKNSFIVNKSIILPLALMLFYFDYKLITFSPSIILAIFTFMYFSPWILKNKLLLSLLVIFTSIIFIRPEHGILELGKFIFMLGSFMLIKHFRNPIKFPLFTIGIFFLIELLLRIYQGGQIDSLYAIKSSGGLLQDSNFTGLFLACVLAPILVRNRAEWSINHKVIDFFVIIFLTTLFLLTFSRTAILFLVFLIISRQSSKLGFVGLIALITFVVYSFLKPENLGNIDGSLETKRQIFIGFMSLLSQGYEQILFGVGRVMAFEFTEDATSVSYAGHTIFGQIVEFGLLLNFIYYFSAFIMIKKLYGSQFIFFLIPIFAAGITGLAPLSYMGIMFFIYYAADNIAHRKI